MGSVAASGEIIQLNESMLIGILGYLIVFLGLILLMFVIQISGKIMMSKTKRKPISIQKSKEESKAENVTDDELPVEVIMMATKLIMDKR